jgi:hypothetical protein
VFAVPLRSITGRLAGHIGGFPHSANGPLATLELIGRAGDQPGLERMATVCLSPLDVDTGVLGVASAGHAPPLRVDAGSGQYLPVQPAPAFGATPTRVPAGDIVWPVGRLSFSSLTDWSRNRESRSRRAWIDCSKRWSPRPV